MYIKYLACVKIFILKQHSSRWSISLGRVAGVLRAGGSRLGVRGAIRERSHHSAFPPIGAGHLGLLQGPEAHSATTGASELIPFHSKPTLEITVSLSSQCLVP